MNKKIKNIYSVGAFVLAVGAVIACSEEEPIVTISTNKNVKVNYDEKIINRLVKVQDELIEIMKLVYRRNK